MRKAIAVATATLTLIVGALALAANPDPVHVAVASAPPALPVAVTPPDEPVVVIADAVVVVYEPPAYGTSGQAVLDFQRWLLVCGLDPGPLDSVYGARTASAARAAGYEVNVPAPPAPTFTSSGWGCCPSVDHWLAISACETGAATPTSGWRTGYFGIEAGYAIGDLSWDEQLAWANRIWASFGPGAWGCKSSIP